MMARNSSAASTTVQPSLRRKRIPLGEASLNNLDDTFPTSDGQSSKMSRSSSSSSVSRPAKRRLLGKGDIPTFMTTSYVREPTSAMDGRPVSVALRPPTPPRPHQALEPTGSPPRRRQSFLPTTKSNFSLNTFTSHMVAPSPVPAMFALSPAPVREREPVRKIDFSALGPSRSVSTKQEALPTAENTAVLDVEHNPFAVPTVTSRSMIPTTPGGRKIFGGISKFGQSPAPVRSLPPPMLATSRPAVPLPSPAVAMTNNIRPKSIVPATPKRIMGDISRFNTPSKAKLVERNDDEDVEMAEVGEASTVPAEVAVKVERMQVMAEASEQVTQPVHQPRLSGLPRFSARKSLSTIASADSIVGAATEVSMELVEPAQGVKPAAPRPVSALPRAASRRSLAGPPARTSAITTRGQVAAQAMKPSMEPPTISALPVGPRRPMSRPLNAPPSAVGAATNGSAEAAANPSLRRRPSYPSSLGLGAGPSTSRKPSNSRVVSNPLAARSVSGSGPPAAAAAKPSTAVSMTAAPVAMKASGESSRSVSAPSKPRASLSMSTRRDGGFSSDANKSFVHLDQLLSKLQVMPERSVKPATTNMAPPALHRPIPMVNTHRTMSSLSAPARFRLAAEPATEDPDVSIKASSLEALVTSKVTSGCLRGITAFVDVRTEDGDDISMLYVDMLKHCGARVLVRPSESCTHIIYKSGKAATLSWFRRQKEPKPYIVGAGWVTKCKEEGKKVAEDLHAVQVEDEGLFQKRRKSMEPKQLALMTAGNLLTTSRANLPEAYASSLAQARCKSLLYARSPLKKVYKTSLPTCEDEA